MTVPAQMPQHSYGLRWCMRCNEMRPTKGGKFLPLFTCALHQKPKAQA